MGISSVLMFVTAFLVTASGQTIIRGTSSNAGGLSGTVRAFESCLGGADNGNALGPLAGGRRSINWDAAIVPFKMPFDFFNSPPTTRGAVFSPKQLRVSNDVPVTDMRFNSIVLNAQSIQFQRFSQKRLFSPLKRNVVNIQFRIPGSKKRACVSGFGAVFTDVDLAGKTRMRFFDDKRRIIRNLPVAARSSGLSFLGICRSRPICKVSITLGNISLQRLGSRFGVEPGSGKVDVVVLDDFLYAEPQAQ